jgi:biopolymer transport protein ExbD
LKLESTLSDRGGALYTAPLIDVILMLIIFFLFGSNLVLKSGFEVKLPTSTASLPSAEDAHIITVIPGEMSKFYFNDQWITLEQLPAALDDSMQRSKEVILLGDEEVDYGSVMKIANLVIQQGFELSFATQQEIP